MAGWMIRLSEYYMQPVHDLMKAEIMESHHIHCDETPFIMPSIKSKEYMGVPFSWWKRYPSTLPI